MRYSLGTNEFVWWLKECASKSKSGTASALNHFSYTVHQSRVRCRTRECDVRTKHLVFNCTFHSNSYSMLDAWCIRMTQQSKLYTCSKCFRYEPCINVGFSTTTRLLLTFLFSRSLSLCFHFSSLFFSQPVQHTEMDVISNVIYEPHMRDFHFSAEVIDRPMDFSVVWLRGAKIDKTLTKLN